MPPPPGVSSTTRSPAGITCRPNPRIYDFGWQRARKASGRGPLFPLQLQARAAQGRAVRRLGSACSDGCVLVPASLLAFLDRFGVLDGGLPAQAMASDIALPFRGRFMLVVDSEREQRPAGVELEVAAARRDGERDVVAQHLAAEHRDRLRHHRVHLARHHAAAGLERGQRDLAEACARPARHPAHVAGAVVDTHLDTVGQPQVKSIRQRAARVADDALLVAVVAVPPRWIAQQIVRVA